MPYKNQQAGKTGHGDLVENPDVVAFLQQCVYIREPSDKEGEALAGSYLKAPAGGVPLPVKVAASDASTYTDAISGKFPSTQIGYIKVSMVLIDMAAFASLSVPGSRFVDPFKVAAMQRNAKGVAFTLPGSNVCYGGELVVREGFRRAVFDQLSDARSNFDPHGNYRIVDTLIFLAQQSGHELHACPVCHAEVKGALSFTSAALTLPCPHCATTLYATDMLSLHDEISDFGNNATVITRFMNVAEHLMMATLIRMLADKVPDALAQMAFVIDGPLALFGRPAWIHRPLMALYYGIEQQLLAKNLPPPLIMGLQKDGQVMEHARSIKHYLGPNTFIPVADDYREKWISGKTSDAKTHGSETYYGQDFIFKSTRGGVFCLALPYPMVQKGDETVFSQRKVEVARYGNRLGRAFDIVREFEFDLYENSIIPVALAHRHASISLMPGGKVLDLITRAGLGL